MAQFVSGDVIARVRTRIFSIGYTAAQQGAGSKLSKNAIVDCLTRLSSWRRSLASRLLASE